MFSNLHPSLKNAFYSIIGIFILLFIATYYTFKVALSQPNDLVDKNYYQIGLNYEKSVSLSKKFKQEGYEFQFITNVSDFNKGTNKLELKYMKNFKKITGKEITILLERGATNKFNQMISLKEKQDGIYSGNIVFEDSGKWIMTVSVKENSGEFQERKIIFVN